MTYAAVVLCFEWYAPQTLRHFLTRENLLGSKTVSDF